MLSFSIYVVTILCLRYAYGATTSTFFVSNPGTSTCPFRTINYLTHTLPRQCLTSTRPTSHLTKSSTTTVPIVSSIDATTRSGTQTHQEPRSDQTLPPSSVVTSIPSSILSGHSLVTSVQRVTTIPATPGANPVQVPLLSGPADEDSPLESGNFLSFEDWKKQNLINAGQSEHLGRNVRAEQRVPRKRQENVHNTLDSLGDDAEIDIDFSGLVPGTMDTSNARAVHQDGRYTDSQRSADTGSNVERRYRSKEAGTTCKERFNYASFDCAANVLKSNSEAKNANLVLRENKDLYMLNKCSASNKFIILELCEDIRIDTVALANFEFFSSSFRTFRVSVSDRYPIKIDKWKSLGVFEARNTREVQAFLIQNPAIWARYIRIEFLTHYGTEFYCPISLVRVHGTTMLDEYKHDQETSMDEDDDDDEDENENVGGSHMREDKLVPEAVDESLLTGQHPNALDKQHAASTGSMASRGAELSSLGNSQEPSISAHHASTSPNKAIIVQQLLLSGYGPDFCCDIRSLDCLRSTGAEYMKDLDDLPTLPAVSVTAAVDQPKPPSSVTESRSLRHSHTSPTQSIGHSSNIHREQQSFSTAKNSSESKRNVSLGGDHHKPDPTIKEQSRSQAVKQSGSGTQPQPASPTMQESFFKSVQKRLQQLESNSSLSLQYIEEQSRALRDAFRKVEQRQLGKTSTFLEHLNQTVLNELREFRQQYDQLWQSTVIELEFQRERYQQESQAMHARLGVLADELIFQRRVSILQMVLILVCLGLILFSRGAVNDYLELPLLQNVLSRSPSSKWIAVSSDSRTASPVTPDTRSGLQLSAKQGILKSHTRSMSEDSNNEPISPAGLYSPPTPVSSDGYSDAELVKSEPRMEEPEFDPVDIQRPSTSPPVLPSTGDPASPGSVNTLDDITIESRILAPESPADGFRAIRMKADRPKSTERHLTWNLPD